MREHGKNAGYVVLHCGPIQPNMRKANNLALIGHFAVRHLASGAARSTFADQLEMLEWSDPERAAQIIDAASPLPAELPAAEIEMLEIRAMVYADSSRDDDVNTLVQRLDAIARAGDEAAARAALFVRAYSARQHREFATAESELRASTSIQFIPIPSVIALSLERCILGQDDAALPFLERALDVANKMHHDLRILHAMLALARIYIDSGNFDRATVLLKSARGLATGLGDEAGLVETEERVSDIADRRGDRTEERRAALAGLEHAKR
jgi:tetratricopeptide (TPR) repeat protein